MNEMSGARGSSTGAIKLSHLPTIPLGERAGGEDAQDRFGLQSNAFAPLVVWLSPLLLTGLAFLMCFAGGDGCNI